MVPIVLQVREVMVHYNVQFDGERSQRCCSCDDSCGEY